MIKFICDVFITGLKIDLAIIYICSLIFGGCFALYLLCHTEHGIYWFLGWFIFVFIYAYYQADKESKKTKKEKNKSGSL